MALLDGDIVLELDPVDSLEYGEPLSLCVSRSHVPAQREARCAGFGGHGLSFGPTRPAYNRMDAEVA